jgi:hypothetical protein
MVKFVCAGDEIAAKLTTTPKIILNFMAKCFPGWFA